MRSTIASLLVAVLLGTPFLALGATPGRVTHTIKNADQRTRSPGTARGWGMSWTDTDFKVLKETTASADTTEQLFYWDAQVKVTCSDRRANNAHRSGALFCWTQSETGTVSLGLNYASGYGNYNLGEGAGIMMAPNISGTMTSLPGACFSVPSGVGPVFDMVPSQDFKDGSAHPYRDAACSNGRPCRLAYSAADCAVDASTCLAANADLGVYLGGVPTSTTVNCYVQEAR